MHKKSRKRNPLSTNTIIQSKKSKFYFVEVTGVKETGKTFRRTPETSRNRDGECWAVLQKSQIHEVIDLYATTRVMHGYVMYDTEKREGFFKEAVKTAIARDVKKLRDAFLSAEMALRE